jgi:hypothetical protein
MVNFDIDNRRQGKTLLTINVGKLAIANGSSLLIVAYDPERAEMIYQSLISEYPDANIKKVKEGIAINGKS